MEKRHFPHNMVPGLRDGTLRPAFGKPGDDVSHGRGEARGVP